MSHAIIFDAGTQNDSIYIYIYIYIPLAEKGKPRMNKIRCYICDLPSDTNSMSMCAIYLTITYIDMWLYGKR